MRGRKAGSFLPGKTLVAVSVLLLSVATISSVQAAGTIAGTVFQDFNADGVFNTSPTAALPAVDVGVGGVTVTAYDVTGVTATTTTSSDVASPGQYTLSSAALAALPAGTVLRIEFTGLSVDTQPGPQGANSATTVQFVTATTENLTNVNFSLSRPGEYCQTNPRLATSCFVLGDQLIGANQNNPVVVSHPYNASGIDPTLEIGEALAKQVGSTWGLAYHRTARTLFVAAYTKRAAGYGPGTGTPTSDGTGTIYRITSGSPADGAPFVDLDDLFGASTTGDNPHTDLDPDPPDFDSGAYGAVGKVALGDIDLSEDDTTLYVVNLADRQLYRLPVGLTPTPPTADQVSRFVVPDPGCVNGIGRSFGVKVRRGLVYVGGICTAENGGTADNLLAYIYSFDPNTSTWSAAPVLQFPLNYPRGCADLGDAYGKTCLVDGGTPVLGSLAEWRPWIDTLDTSFPAGFDHGFTTHPQPILSDIEFVGDDMVVGFRDRFGDQIGQLDPGPTGQRVTPFHLSAIPAGDLLRASPNGAGGWTIENNAQSVPAGAFGPSAGVNNQQGPGNGEFYYRDNRPDFHSETGFGGLAQVPGFPEIAMTALTPISVFSGGTIQLENATGDRAREYEVYDASAAGVFQKANGLGDLEPLCDPAPIEIGNRVWLDTDRDGIQDANETGINGVTVELYRNGVLVGTTVTANGGQYYFNATNATLNGAHGIVPGTGTPGGNSEYEIRVPNIVGENQQAGLGTLSLTIPNGDGTDNGRARDSDGVIRETAAVITIPAADVGRAGFNNHTYDFGFVPPPPPVEPPPPPPPPPPPACLGNDLQLAQAVNPSPVVAGQPLTYTLMVTNAGQVEANGVQVTDLLPSGVTFVSATASQGSCSHTSGTVSCQIGTVTQGIHVTVEIIVTPAASGELSNTASVSSSVSDIDCVVENNTSTVQTPVVTPVADLQVFKTATPGPILSGTNLVYTLRVTNQGPDTAIDAALTDTLPAGVIFVSATPSQGSCSEASGVITCSLGQLASGAQATVRIVVTVGSSVSATPPAGSPMNTGLQVAGSGVGDLLLFPYWTVQGRDTLIAIGNAFGGQAQRPVHVRIREGVNSQEVVDFTICLSPGDIWTAVLTAGPNGQGQLMVGDSGSCDGQEVSTTLINIASASAPGTDPRPNNNQAEVATTVQTAFTGAPVTGQVLVLPASFGYIEAYTMEIGGGDDALWGVATPVNVGGGFSSSYNATALVNFNAENEGATTAGNQAVAEAIAREGGVDKEVLLTRWTANPAIGSSTQLILTFPGGHQPGPTDPISAFVFDEEERINFSPRQLILPQEVNVCTIASESATTTIQLTCAGSEGLMVTGPGEGLVAGWLRLLNNNNRTAADGLGDGSGQEVDALDAPPDSRWPVLGLVFSTFTGSQGDFDQSFPLHWQAIRGTGGVGEAGTCAPISAGCVGYNLPTVQFAPWKLPDGQLVTPGDNSTGGAALTGR